MIYTTQPQLLKIPLDKKDVVYTPDNVARDMVEFFNPIGKILEPSSGDGAILKYLPTADWCEIEKGKDFFNQRGHYDWIIGNPPYSIFAKWIRHSFTIADNIVYIMPAQKNFASTKILKEITEYGGIKHLRIYSEKNFKEWSIGFAIGAVHYKKHYKGDMGISYFD